MSARQNWEDYLGPRWRETLRSIGLHQDSVVPLAWYAESLLDLRLTVDAWPTTNLHVLSRENPVLDWFKGTALRLYSTLWVRKPKANFSNRSESDSKPPTWQKAV